MSRTVHNPEVTRRTLLESAATQIHRLGFQATSLDAILAETGVSKGALYHHFANKHELGLAVLHEVFREGMLHEWSAALSLTSQPVDALLELLGHKRDSLSLCAIECGCPINNLAQELASVNEPFRKAIEAILESWRHLIADALERGRGLGCVRADVDCRAEAVFITSLIEGATGAAKTARDPSLLETALHVLAAHLESLRATPSSKPARKTKPRVAR